MKLIWYISVFCVLLFILLHSPQRSNSGAFSSDVQLLTPTRTTQKNLQILIAVSISIFFILTMFLVISSETSF